MKEQFKTSIGGQALFEGVMMRGPDKSAMAVRVPGGEIDMQEWRTKNPRAWYRKTPFVRGIFNMGSSLAVGMSCLTKSMEKSGIGEDEEPTRFELWLSEKLGKNVYSVISGLALVLGGAIAIGLFVFLPTFIAGGIRLLTGAGDTGVWRSLIEGVLKIVIFLIYLALISKIADIKRFFAYHGAEHKTISCYESGLPLTVENARAQSRYHPRCGTSFLLIVLVVSILVFSVIGIEGALVRSLVKLAMLPVVIGIAYEFIKFTGRYRNPVTRFLSAPGLWFQRLTTSEPDDSMIEVAIEAMKPCIPEVKGDDEW